MLTLPKRAKALLRLSALRTTVQRPLRSRKRSRYLQIVKNCTLHKSNHTPRPRNLTQQLIYSSTFRPVEVQLANSSVHLTGSLDRTYRDHLETPHLKFHRNVKIVHTSMLQQYTAMLQPITTHGKHSQHYPGVHHGVSAVRSSKGTFPDSV